MKTEVVEILGLNLPVCVILDKSFHSLSLGFFNCNMRRIIIFIIIQNSGIIIKKTGSGARTACL